MEKHRDVFRYNIRQYGMLFALIAIVLIFQILTGGILLRPINVSRLILQNSYILILAVGMMLCILTGGHIDLSVGSVVAMVGASSALFSVRLGLPASLSIFLGLLVGLLAGMWQGFWIAFVKIPPFIVTLAGMLIFNGVNNIILNGQTVLLPKLYITIASDSIPDFFSVNGLHLTTVIIGVVCSVAYLIAQLIIRFSKIRNGYEVNSKQWFMTKTALVVLIINLFAYWLARANGLPYIVILLVVIIAVYSFITNKTVAGRHIYALGGNAKAAELSGINTRKVMFWVYANMGFLAALAGIVFAGRLNSATPTAGQGFELDTIAACFIGGASATGGVGTIIGAIIGGFIMGIMNNGMSIMGISTFWQSIIKGLVTILAVAFDVISKSKAKARY
ncbi:MAG: sugar ABC transporter permease [Clostridiaceae bacterium]|jgi:putative multiple sugar transport system permease protein|nr:sugar ABC transporter permease [Clostridiaceae bacterium]